MEIFVYIVHILTALALVVTILIQSGKGGGLGSGFGGAAASATKIFGGGGTANILERATVVLATIFMATSLTLAYMSSHVDSLMDLDAKTDSVVDVGEDPVLEVGTGSGDEVIVAPDGTPEATEIELQAPDESEKIEAAELENVEDSGADGEADAEVEEVEEANEEATPN